MFGDPFTNPKNWLPDPLGNIGSFGSRGTPSRSNSRFWGADLSWVSPKDIQHHQIFDSEVHIADSALAENSLQLLPTDTVVVVVRGMILARKILIALTQVQVAINQDIKSLMPRRPMISHFL